jgi:hypothetical protein
MSIRAAKETVATLQLVLSDRISLLSDHSSTVSDLRDSTRKALTRTESDLDDTVFSHLGATLELLEVASSRLEDAIAILDGLNATL